MKNNSYKAAMQDEKFDEKRLDELCEMLKSSPAEMSEKKPKKNIRLSVILAAALIVSAIGCTTVAAAGAEFFGFKIYFDGVKEKYEISDDVPMAADPSIYAAEVSIKAKSMGEHKPKIVPKVNGLVGDGYNLFIDIEVDATALKIPDNIPEDALFGFSRITAARYDGIDCLEQQVDRIPLQEDGIYRITAHERYICHMQKAGDPYEMLLYDFGYSTGDEFVVLDECKFSLTLDADMFNTVENHEKKSISGPQEVRGVMLEVSIKPLSIVVTGRYSEINELKLLDDRTFLERTCFEIYMRDGSVIDSNAITDLIWSVGGTIDFDNDISYAYRGFSVPIDVDDIVAVSVHGVMFEFDSPEEASDEQLDTIESYVKKSGPHEVKGVMLEVSLSPLSLVISGNRAKMVEALLSSISTTITGEHSPHVEVVYKYNEAWSGGEGKWPFEFYMRDGTVIGSEEYFHDTAFYGLFCSVDGKVDRETDTFYDHYGFSVPIDVDDIVAVSVHGVMFEFDSPEEASAE